MLKSKKFTIDSFYYFISDEWPKTAFIALPKNGDNGISISIEGKIRSLIQPDWINKFKCEQVNFPTAIAKINNQYIDKTIKLLQTPLINKKELIIFQCICRGVINMIIFILIWEFFLTHHVVMISGK